MGTAITSEISCNTRGCILSGPGDLFSFNFFSFCFTMSSDICILLSSLAYDLFPKKGMSSPSASTVNTLLKFLRKVSAFSCSFFVKVGSSSSSSDITRSGMPARVFSWDCAYFQNALGLALVFFATSFSIILFDFLVRPRIWFRKRLNLIFSSSAASCFLIRPHILFFCLIFASVFYLVVRRIF